MATYARLTQKLKRDLKKQEVKQYGFDGGNSTAVLSDGSRTDQISSYIGTGDVEQYVSFGGDLVGGGLRVGDHVLDDGDFWFVGDLARMQCSDATTNKANEARYYMGHTKRLFKTMIAARSVHDNPDENQHAIRAKVVTGIPIALYRQDATLPTRIAESFIGDYWYRYINYTGEYTIHLVIEACHVMQEGLSPLIAFGVKGKPQGFIDIGGNSIDVGVVDENKVPLYERSDSLQGWGTERIIEIVSAQFRAMHGRFLSPREQAKVIPALMSGKEMTVYNEGEQIIPVHVFHDALTQVTDMNDTFLKKTWGAKPGHDLAQVMLIGGGASIIIPSLYSGCVVTPEHPYAKNAEAYAAIAERLEQKNAWKTVLGAY